MNNNYFTLEEMKLLALLAERKMPGCRGGWCQYDADFNVICHICSEIIYKEYITIDKFKIMHEHGMQHIKESGLAAFI